MYIKIDQPSAETEHKILKLVRAEEMGTKEQDESWKEFSKTVGKLEIEDILKARRDVLSIHMSEQLEEYLVQLIIATRKPEKYDSGLKNNILYGASPRATIALTLAAKAHAFLEGRGYVVPQDIKDIAPDVLRHRIIVTYEAEAEGISSEDIVAKVLNKVAVP